MTNDLSRSDKRRIGGTSPQLIHNAEALVDWLFATLDKQGPQLPVSTKMRRTIDDLRRELLENGYLDEPVCTSSEILGSMYPKLDAKRREHCGVGVLQFVGQFSDLVILMDCNPHVPLVHIARMMISLGGKELAGLRTTTRAKWIKSTNEFEQKHKVSVNVRIPKPYRYDFVWDLTDVPESE